MLTSVLIVKSNVGEWSHKVTIDRKYLQYHYVNRVLDFIDMNTNLFSIDTQTQRNIRIDASGVNPKGAACRFQVFGEVICIVCYFPRRQFPTDPSLLYIRQNMK